MQPGYVGEGFYMKVLSGRFPIQKNVMIEGDVTYNGVAQTDITRRLPQFVAYMTQRDKHFPTFTVKETLDYAHRFCGGEMSQRAEKKLSKVTSEENKAALDAVQALYTHYPDMVICCLTTKAELTRHRPRSVLTFSLSS
ncbi:unnamed protein product [Peronospora destructor]|uniref:Uncharacterized protein n=1 Tax=Peronospora destructor TaxID=86335 RepID=A0AAV0T902_9STRA|nr:unnamed protein product [Peronospora destructor]